MDPATRGSRPHQRMISILTAIGLVVAIPVVSAPSARAAKTCRAKNVSAGTPADSNLQRVINAASSGDTITVKFECVGHFRIDKALTLLGEGTSEVPKPVLDGNGTARVLEVRASVTITNVKITGGSTAAGGGILNWGTLTLQDVVVSRNRASAAGGGIANVDTLILNDTVVRGNASAAAGGIYNMMYETVVGTVILNGTSSVIGNRGRRVGGGVGSDGAGSITLNDSSSIRANNTNGDGGGVFISQGTLTMNDSSSISGNTANADDHRGGRGGGVFVGCGGTLSGMVDGGNVHDNFRGTATPVENNIVDETGCV